MPRIPIRSVLWVVVSCAILLGCGTKFACGPEFGAPPERAFWCSPLSDLREFFEVQPTRVLPPPSTIMCDETLADRECRSK